MRLLHTTSLRIEQFIEHKRNAVLVSSERDAVPEYAVPRYAILSHTWEDDEVLFEDVHVDRAAVTRKVGYKRITQSCLQARFDGYGWVWEPVALIKLAWRSCLKPLILCFVGTRISLFAVYLAAAGRPQPVYQDDDPRGRPGGTVLRRYSRGWTLQELIAPSNVVFFSRDWRFIGTKQQHMHRISTVTGVDNYALSGENLARMSVARRMTWLAKRETTRAEDITYRTLGMFGINMLLQYGEGPNAFVRLQEEIVKGTEEQSIFAWREDDSLDYYREDYGNSFERRGLLAGSPRLFRTSTSIMMIPWDRPSRPHPVLTRQGLSIQADKAVFGQSYVAFVPPRHFACTRGYSHRLNYVPTCWPTLRKTYYVVESRKPLPHVMGGKLEQITPIEPIVWTALRFGVCASPDGRNSVTAKRPTRAWFLDIIYPQLNAYVETKSLGRASGTFRSVNCITRYIFVSATLLCSTFVIAQVGWPFHWLLSRKIRSVIAIKVFIMYSLNPCFLHYQITHEQRQC